MKTMYRAVPKNAVVGWGLILGSTITLSMLAGCDSEDPVEPDPPEAVALSLAPDSLTFTAFGDTARFVATLTDQYGDAFDGTVEWSSTDPGLFTVASNGLVTSVANGSGSVLAVYDTLSAAALVHVRVNLPPEPRSEMDDVPLSVGGGPWGLQPAAFFHDPNDDILDLTFTTRLSDPTVATAEVVTDTVGHAGVVMTGTAVGTAELTITATDPGGLTAEQSLTITVDDEGYTPIPGVTVSDNRIEVTGLALVGNCSPPVVNLTTATGLVITINSSTWHSREDSAADWTHVEGTEREDGRLCPYTTTAGGEYRLVANMTSKIDEHHDPYTGDYRSENTFTVVDTVVGNRPPVLDPAHFDDVTLGSRGGPLPFVAGRFFTDPDGDTLTFTLANTDSASMSAVMLVDSAGDAAIILTGRAEGASTVTVTATDPGELSADWTIDVTVEDSDYTPWYAVLVDNGVLVAFGIELAVCLPPVIELEWADGNVYTVHESKWQSRSDSTEEWSDIEGTELTNGSVCPYLTTEPGDYRLVYEMSILFDPHQPAVRGWYRSPNHFTVSSSGDLISAAATPSHARRPAESMGMDLAPPPRRWGDRRAPPG